MRPGSKINALLSTARIANVPSVVSNLGVGVLLGSVESGADFSWPWLLMVAAVLFYVAGNFLNDWADRDWDIANRPERALPRRLFWPHEYLNFASAGIAVGMILAGIHGWGAVIVSAVLVSLIALYTKIHKTAAWSVIPMGLCRACLPVLGYVAMRGSIAGPALLPALALLLYIVVLSMSARWESRAEVPGEMKHRSMLLLAATGLIAAVLPILIMPNVGWVGLVPFSIWMALCLTKYQSPVPSHVSALLAGIPLVDWVILLPMALIWLGLGRVAAFDPMFSIAVFLPPLAFILGRALQRLAPAT
ncbi:UbiA family prenyltransferase [Akkermansiaceae bacterium]|nr:UbiA family prenyltransferase [Akkermansiaceae bacterium]